MLTSPTVVIGRPHSGSRLLVHLLQQAGIFMGADVVPNFGDSIGWYRRFVVPLVNSEFFPDWSGHEQADSEVCRFARQCSTAALESYWGANQHCTPWGWKYCETLFVVPLVTFLFSNARFLHVVRDGRDVALSNDGFFQLTGTHSIWSDDSGQHDETTEYSRFCRAIALGAHGIAEWNGIILSDRQALVKNRFLIQAQAWLNAVTRARFYGSSLGDQYREVRYEDLCCRPRETICTLCRWLGVAPEEEAFRRMSSLPEPGRIGKWRARKFTQMETRDFSRAALLIEPLLADLGYGA